MTDAVTDDRGRPILSAQGHHVVHPDYVNALPWIERRRLTWDDFVARAAEQELPEPSPQDWADTFVLTEGETASMTALVEAFDPGYLGDLEEYFVIRRLGNKPRVCWREADGRLAAMSFGDFRNAYLDRVVPVADDKTAPLAELWLRHRETPRYNRAEFLPGLRSWEVDAKVYNLWPGWPRGLPRERDLTPPIVGRVVEPDDDWDTMEPPEECSLFLDHILENMCGDDDEVYRYVLGWIADMLQRPGLCETAIALTGPSGSGKGTFAKLVGSFVGPCYEPVSDEDHLIGKFNRGLMEAMLVFGDEVSFSSDNQASRTLRNLVTEEILQVEFKGIDRFQARKWFRIIMSANDAHVLNVLPDDRRYLVLNVDAGEHNNKRAYFGPLLDQWADGGRVAMFRWLTGRYWTEELRSGRWEVGQRPITAALQDQKSRSLPPEQMVVQNMLMLGDVPCEFEPDARAGTVFVPTQLLAQVARLDQREVTALGRALGAVAGARSVRATVVTGHGRRQLRGFLLPPLELARRNWERFLRRAVEWPGDADTWAVEAVPMVPEDDHGPF